MDCTELAFLANIQRAELHFEARPSPSRRPGASHRPPLLGPEMTSFRVPGFSHEHRCLPKGEDEKPLALFPCRDGAFLRFGTEPLGDGSVQVSR